jgi:Lrp/AsnC family leucine-responsive transcriptional regulator
MAEERMFDDIDASILTILQDNARTSQADIARTVGLAASAVLERIRKLEQRGVIRTYTALLSAEALDRGMLAFIAVRTTDRPGERRVAQAVAAIPDVLEVHHVAGDDCLLLKMRVRDASHLAQILREQLGPIDGIRSTRTTIVLETVKEQARLPVPRSEPVRKIAS